MIFFESFYIMKITTRKDFKNVIFSKKTKNQDKNIIKDPILEDKLEKEKNSISFQKENEKKIKLLKFLFKIILRLKILKFKQKENWLN